LLDEDGPDIDSLILVNHGLKAGLDEYHSAGDQFFFFKEHSAAKWINAIEKDFCKGVPISYSGTITNGSYPFTDAKIELITHDYTCDYRDKFKELKMFNDTIVL
jgi:hypothetical protein